MVFQSILFASAEEGKRKEPLEAPLFFSDLNLDQIIEKITAPKKEYDLKPFFHFPLQNIEAIKYRQDIMRDLESQPLFDDINRFAGKMRSIRSRLTMIDNLYYQLNKEGWFLQTVDAYCDAVNVLAHDLAAAPLNSRGLRALREYLISYVNSNRFSSLLTETKELKTRLSSIKYCLLIKDNRVRVRQYESENDYSARVEEDFKRFQQGAVKDYRVSFAQDAGMNHVEAKILDLVARLYPEIFAALAEYCVKNAGFRDETIVALDREIQFYLAYLEHIAPLQRAGLTFCYPAVSDASKEVYDYEGFDLALAHKLLSENSSVVCNDFYLQGPERVLVVSGPNQGGKTTFARTFGQLHYLAALGYPVPGREAKLFLFDQIFTHFEKEEDIKNLHGKLQDDLARIHRILSRATPNSIIILNEVFASTTLDDSIALSKKIMEKILRLDCLCVHVTFLVELASLSEKTVSMVSTVHPENLALRTFKILRRPADGLSYALSIAERHRLTYDCLKERLRS